MATLEQKIDLLLRRDIVRTSFETKVLGRGAEQGEALGQGGCKAVILRLNYFTTDGVRNEESGLPPANTCPLIYYGDATRQTFELRAGENSQIIFCKDLNEVWLRNYLEVIDEEDTAFEAVVNYLVYYGREDGE